MGRSIFRHAFVPALLAASVASWIYRPSIELFLTAHAIRLDFVSAVFFALIACVLISEQIYPVRPEWNYRLLSDVRGWSRLGRDLVYLFVITQFTALLIKAASSRLSQIHPISVWPHAASIPLRIALAFLLVEFMSYWMHRVAHRIPIFWQFHSTHHVIAELNGLKSLRTHPVDNLFFYVARNTPLLLLGVDAPDILAVAYFGSLLGIISHANISVSDRALGWFVNYPRFHAVHHSVDLSESNSNFGCHTVVWDHVFGTFRNAARVPLLIGVDEAGPRSLWAELMRPFYGAVTSSARPETNS